MIFKSGLRNLRFFFSDSGAKRLRDEKLASLDFSEQLIITLRAFIICDC